MTPFSIKWAIIIVLILIAIGAFQQRQINSLKKRLQSGELKRYLNPKTKTEAKTPSVSV